MNAIKRICFFYKFYRLYDNGRFVSLIKAIGGELGKRTYIKPIGIAPGIFVR